VPIAAREILPPRWGVKLAIFGTNGLRLADQWRQLPEAALALLGNAPQSPTAPPQEPK